MFVAVSLVLFVLLGVVHWVVSLLDDPALRVSSAVAVSVSMLLLLLSGGFLISLLPELLVLVCSCSVGSFIVLVVSLLLSFGAPMLGAG
mgnify:CR=1 FL=1